ncbi:MAG: LON peptidase substrate-binding domain-containing protein, partial [Chthoniobacterales bacterium]
MSDEPQSALQSGPAPGSAVSPNESNETGTSTGGKIPDVLSILPVRSFVVFPGTIAPLQVRRAASIKLLDETLPQSKIVGVITQRDENVDAPQPQDLYHVGTAVMVMKLLRQSEDHVVAI